MAATETLLRKLQPLIPDRVAQWQHARPLADADLRELIDREIHETARRLLGPYESRLLLSLPPQKLCRGEFDLGVVQYEQPKWQVGLRRGELLQNLAILGRSGAGKTNVVFHLLRQLLAKGVHVLFFDWKRTARHLLSSLPVRPAIFTPGRDIAPLTFNPFLPPPDEERSVYALQLVDTLGAAFTLGDGAKSVLTTALLDCYALDVQPTASELLRRVRETKSTGRASGWQASAIRSLQSLAVSLSQPGSNPPGTPVASLVNQSTIIELDALSDSAKAFLVPMLLLWIYRVQLAARRRERLQLVVVIEEAHHVLFRSERRTHENVMNRLLRQFREIGVGTIVVDQHPHAKRLRTMVSVRVSA